MASSCRDFTYQTRFGHEGDEVLSAVATLSSRVERSLFAQFCAGADFGALKSETMKRHELTARQFNAIKVQLEGKIAACKQQKRDQIKELQQRISKLEKQVKHDEKLIRRRKPVVVAEKVQPAEETKSAEELARSPETILIRTSRDQELAFKIHHRKRRLHSLCHQLEELQKEQKSGKVSLCFGGKKLFHAQFNREANGYKNHAEWLADWKSRRSSQFTTLGSKDESGGNQTCTASIQEDGKLTLRLRLPDALVSQYGKYYLIPNVHFAYGHSEICRALQSCMERVQGPVEKSVPAKKQGEAIHYRFCLDPKGWRVLATVGMPKVESTTTERAGVIGIDLNADHIAAAELDRFGNVVSTRVFPLVTYGLSTHQAEALIGDASAALVAFAKEAGKPLVCEALDFARKKLSLREIHSPRYARMLSGFAYQQFAETLRARCWKEGVDFHTVNPAYTSVIGRVKFATRYGLSTHQAAALTIGRRYLKLSERAPRHEVPIPDGKGNHVTFSLPVRNREEHVWKFWAALAKRLKTALAALSRTTHGRSSRPPDACDGNSSRDAGETPACEPSTTLLGGRPN